MKISFFLILSSFAFQLLLTSCGDSGSIEEPQAGARIGKVEEINTNETFNESETSDLKENCKNLVKVHNDSTNLYAGSTRYSFDYQSYFKACSVDQNEESKRDLNLKVVRVSDDIFRFNTSAVGEKYYIQNIQTDRNGYFKSFCEQVNYEGKTGEEVEEENVTRYVMTGNGTAVKAESVVCQEDRQDVCFRFYELRKVENTTRDRYEIVSEHRFEIEKEDAGNRGFVMYTTSSNKDQCDEDDPDQVETLRLKFVRLNN